MIDSYVAFLQAANPYLTGIPANTYSPYYATGHLVPTLLGPDPTAVASQLGPVVPQTVQVAQQKIPRSDRLEVSDSCCLAINLYSLTIYWQNEMKHFYVNCAIIYAYVIVFIVYRFVSFYRINFVHTMTNKMPRETIFFGLVFIWISIRMPICWIYLLLLQLF